MESCIVHWGAAEVIKRHFSPRPFLFKILFKIRPIILVFTLASGSPSLQRGGQLILSCLCLWQRKAKMWIIIVYNHNYHDYCCFIHYHFGFYNCRYYYYYLWHQQMKDFWNYSVVPQIKSSYLMLNCQFQSQIQWCKTLLEGNKISFVQYSARLIFIQYSLHQSIFIQYFFHQSIFIQYFLHQSIFIQYSVM